MTEPEPLEPRHLALVGPTASGKSTLAMELARKIPTLELVSVDSMQVYRGMNIGTAKPTVAEQGEIRHHLIDLVDPSEDFQLRQFQAAAFEAIADIESRGNTALLVGGTGLYLQAITDNLTIPGQFPDVRADLDLDGDTEALHAKLMELDPLAAERMEPTNRRRVLRALEVTVGSGQPFSTFGPGIDAFPPSRFEMFGVAASRETNRQQIGDRVAAMLDSGWLEEVETLKATGPLSKTAGQALGYKELLAHLEGDIALEVATEEIVNRTRSFARRQRKWFERDPRVTWFDTEGDPENVLPALLRDCQAVLEGGDRQ